MGGFWLLATLNLGTSAPPSSTAVLSWRQQRLYVHRVTVWRRAETFSATGAPSGSWSGVVADVPCYLETAPSQFELQGDFLNAEGDNIFTLDKFHFVAGANIRAGDVVEITTGHAALLGGYWRIRGDQQPHTYFANKSVHIASRLALPPNGVS